MKYNYKLEDEVFVLSFSGDLIGESDGAELIEVIQENIDKGVKLCAIDISGLRYINSSGIGVLITILTKFRNRGGEVVLVNPGDQVKKLLIITKLNNIFQIEDSLEGAKKSLSNS
ncbi:STAS domain-containing protein [Marinigracilibium pacificum]|uniref:Anti-sigma factor antagonist n=1 Tax=Marinigracilibium pacificum TaxID=2729599 RepID=A0A848J8D9_9BACT|nr:STAS domain-containing protein [Marinigracilibium pacificum]NMM49332.1 STAS domain-containing protein [Marinigracilibium pacificum]